MTGSTMAAHGLRVVLGDRWEGRLYLRELRDDGPHAAAHGHSGESFNPVLHLANFALAPGRGDFGTGAVEAMGPGHAFLALLEYDGAEAGRPLFASSGVPRLALRHFDGNALQRKVPGQLGCQRFFTTHGRPFCLYAVLGSRRAAGSLVREINDVLATLQVGAR